MTTHALDCAAFDERIADYLEGDLDSAARHEVEAHVASCVRCAALLRDLEHIRVSAAELPELTPSTDLWGGIARRIDTPVLPLTRPAPNVSAGRRRFDWVRRAAVAAALVAVTAGVTYTLTVAHGPGAATSSVATTQPTPPGPSLTASTDSVRSERVVPSTSGRANPQDTELVRPPSQRVANAPATDTYAREIDRLRTIFARNRSQLDPRTAAIIEANLKVIDDAIAQSKAALAQDPASRFLNNQLNNALGKKLELLQTAALLPNRT
ncbi:MAG TPA: zf-HC2 domain-containing protein [Gemmatimonadaceae bacterium]|nr:zf-HC2 domain-containing protein [Gemmatimonadaceae bacterium]